MERNNKTEKVTYFVNYQTESFSTELRDEAKHAFDEGAQVVEVREVVLVVGRSKIEITVTTQW
ncbi:MAG: hypothetical protein IKU86_08505 [Thermoguttaceae bacterium]|nr:hypothetical protein [Thermoguttaceae bacterium]